MSGVPARVADQLFSERGDFRQKVEAVQRVIAYAEEDLENGIELSLDGKTWTWRPSAADVIHYVKNAIDNPTDVSTWRG
jgi:hypothetical protein